MVPDASGSDRAKRAKGVTEHFCTFRTVVKQGKGPIILELKVLVGKRIHRSVGRDVERAQNGFK